MPIWFNPGMYSWFNISNLINVIYHSNKGNKIISKDEKFDKTQYSFFIHSAKRPNKPSYQRLSSTHVHT